MRVSELVRLWRAELETGYETSGIAIPAAHREGVGVEGIAP